MAYDLKWPLGYLRWRLKSHDLRQYRSTNNNRKSPLSIFLTGPIYGDLRLLFLVFGSRVLNRF
jgi:hypothetical protein